MAISMHLDILDKNILSDSIKTLTKNLIINSEIAKIFTSSLVSKSNKSSLNISSLTNREKDVAFLVAKGLSNKEISTQIFLSEGTVKNYVTKILDKLELSNRTELAVLLN